MEPEIFGYCDNRFKPVFDAFRQNFSERGEIGACVCVEIEGKAVVDIWAGHVDAAKSRPWRENTLVNAWSVGKAVAALTLLHLLEARRISVSEKISAYWPEFSQAGKEDITFEIVMSHRAGLCGVETPLPDDAYYNWDAMIHAIAMQKPWWQPGTNHGYHTNTFGYLMGEPVRRISGSPIRDYMTTTVANSLKSDFHFGVPPARVRDCADLIYMDRPESAPPSPIASHFAESDDPMSRMRYFIQNNPSMKHFDFNSTQWRRAEFPSTSPQSNARASARIFSELAQIAHYKGDGIVSRALLQRATAIISDGEDLNIGRPTRFGLGFQLSQPDRPLGPNPDTFGHYGNGGHLAFADPSVPLGFAYHMNHQGFAWRDPRNIALTDAVYESL
jgi:CubicO group peptidase (beta-lactamase class C family)